MSVLMMTEIQIWLKYGASLQSSVWVEKMVDKFLKN